MLKKALSFVMALCMAFGLLAISAGAAQESNAVIDPGPSNPDYIHDLIVNLPAATTWADSAWVCQFNGTGEDVYIYAITGSSSTYNLGYSVGGVNNLKGWFPNLKIGSDGICIHTYSTEIYEIHGSTPEGTGGAFNIVISRKPIDLTMFEDLPFTDIPGIADCTTRQDIDLRNGVLYVYANGWITGTSGTTFSPDASFTRAMLWTVLARMNNVDTTGGDPWYAPARKWTMDSGISDGTFPERNASLQEVITMLYNQAGRPTVTQKEDIDANGPVADWARDAMNWAMFKGLLLDETISPAGAVTREQLAVILAQYAVVTAR